LLKFIENYKIK